MNETTTTPGKWNFACDSYGKVQHSRKACVYTVLKGDGGDRIVNVAQRIPNWEDARLMAASKELLEIVELYLELSPDQPPNLSRLARSTVAKAKGTI